MDVRALGFTAIILYLAAASRFAVNVLRANNGVKVTRTETLGLGMLAIALHGLVLYQAIMTSAGLNLGVFNAASLVAWFAVLLILFVSFIKPIENAAIALLPFAALTIGLGMLFPSAHWLPANAPWGLEMHILLSLLAYSLLGIAALLGAMLALEDYWLRHHRLLRAIHSLPPLQTLENLMFHLLAAGFFLLSLSLVSGLIFLDDIFGQHLVHKTALSIMAWLVFAVLLWGRYQSGWRGRRAIRYTLVGFLTLMLAYFGSKVVLELILHRA
jgi:ABC-type uncharacterized transport system permease subunit